MEVKRGDVVLIVAQGDMGKPRPGIVVQASDLAGTDTVLICPLTSDVSAILPLRPTIEPSEANGLAARSQVMTERLSAIRRDRVRRVIGALETDFVDQLDDALLIVLGLAR